MSRSENSLPAEVDRQFQPAGLILLGCLLASQVVIVACSGTPRDVRQPEAAKKSLDGTDEQIFVEGTVEKYYHPNVIMKRAEAFIEKEAYEEALIELNHFLDLHRSHMLAPYAAFRIGEIHLKHAKTIDRDPDPMQKAIAAFERVRREFAGSRFDAQAQQKLEECHDWLAQMHLFVGRFYYRRGSYLAAAHRFEQIVKSYPDKPVAPDALYFLAKAYHDLGADDWARDSLILLAKKYPDSKAASDGNSLLAKIGGAPPETLVAQQPDALARLNGGQAGSQTARTTLSEHPSIPSPPQFGSVGVPPAIAPGQAFTACRLGAWC
jgi:outer membrane protein assembly factor BamD